MRGGSWGGSFAVDRLSGRCGIVAVLLASLAAILALMLVPSRASAEPLCTDTWTGPSEGDWGTAGAWSSGVPTASSVVCIGVGKTVTIYGEVAYAAVLEDGGGLAVEFAALDITDGLERSSVGALHMEEGSLGGVASLAVSGSLSWGDHGTVDGGGSLVIQPGASATITNSIHVSGAAKLINEGTFTLTSSGSIALSEEATVENAGTFNADSNIAGLLLEATGSGSRFINTGTFETHLTGSERASIGMEGFENRGTVNAKAGLLEFYKGVASGASGKWVAEGGHVIFTEGSFPFTGGEWAGSIVLEGSVVVTAEGVVGTNAQVTVFGGEFSVHGALMTVESLDVDSSYSTLGGTGSIAVTKTLSLESARITGTGSLILRSTGSGTISGGVPLRGYTLVNEGTITLTSGYLGFQEGATMVNHGTFTANGGELYGPFGGGQVVNTGTFQVTVATTIDVDVRFTNEGSIVEHLGHFVFYEPVTAEAASLYGGPGNPSTPGHPCPVCGEPIVVATGDLVETQTDLSVGGRGVGLDLTRTYNSQAAAEGTKGIFGYGWSSTFGDHLNIGGLVESGSEKWRELMLYQADGSTVKFRESSATGITGPSGTQDKLSGSPESGYTLTLPDQTKYEFSGSSSGGRLESVVDRDGNTTTLSYGGAGRLETVADPSGRKLTFAYNSEGLVESVKDPMGHTAKYAYESGALATVTLPGESSPRWQFVYGGSRQLTEMTDGRAGKTINEYNGAHQVVSQTDPMKHKLSFEYGGFQTKITNEATGAVTLEQFTSSDEPAAITRGYGTALATTEYFTYNENGYVTSETNGDGQTTNYGYGAEENRTSMLDPEEHETKWTYDTKHDVDTMTTPDGETTTIKRESDGNPETISRPVGEATQTTSYKYNSYGEVTSVENPLKDTWKYEYDSYGDRIGETDPEGNKRTWGYNEDSQETSTVSPRGHAVGAKEAKFTTTIERDAQGRPIKITDPLGHETKYTYNADGDLETKTDPEGNKTTHTYNADDQPTKTEEPNGTVTETEYDGAGQVIKQTDGNKHATEYVRNILEQVSEVIDPLGRKTVREYDEAGNLTSVTDAEKRTTTYRYDPDSRLVEVSYSDGKTPDVKYEYNGDGDRTKMTDGTGESTYKYDQLDRLEESKDGHGDTTSYEYNLANQQTKITYPNGKAVSRAYDNDGRLESVTDWLEHTTKFAYDQDSDLTATAFPAGTSEEDIYEYNDADQMSEVQMKEGAETLASLVYTRNKDGGVTKATTKGLPGEEKPAFSYDEDSRLTKGAGVTYKYDAANNPTTIEKTTYAYNAADELEEAVASKKTVDTYIHNEVGQRVKTTPATGPATSYGYDQAGNLTTVTRPKEGETPAIEDTYTYNGEGLRASETISGSTNYLTWDTADVELPLILNNGTDSFIYGPDGMPIEQINNTTGTVTYLHHDQAGSTRLLTGSTGKTEGSYSYGAYGVSEHSGTATTPLGYDGQYTSSDTGLIYLRAREYDPATAQFLSVDPLVWLTRAPYTYAGDNPLNFGDPSGRAFQICVGGTVSLGFFSVEGNVCYVNTPHGEGVAISGGASRGPGLGANVHLGAGGSNAQTPEEYGGPFANVGGSAQAGFGGYAGAFFGPGGSCTPVVAGGTAGVSAGIGAEAGVGASYTEVIPF
jgi:RHS repeat-associated protein